MRFNFTDEQEEFRGVVQRFLRERSPTSEVWRLMASESGYNPTVWKQLCTDLGLAGIHVPEDYGGQGFGFEELAVVLEEMGRSLLCTPYFSSAVLATNVIANGATEAQKREWLPKLSCGELIATLAASERERPWEIGATSLVAREEGGGYRLTGTKTFVLDGHTAELILVAGRAPGSSGDDGISLFAVPGVSDGLGRLLLDTSTRRESRPNSRFRTYPQSLSARSGQALLSWTRPTIRPPSRLPAKWSAGRARYSIPLSNTRACACSSVGRSVPSRRSSTNVRICCWISN